MNETLCSLKFGLRAMKVHNVAQVNVEVRWVQELVNPFWGMSGKILDRACNLVPRFLFPFLWDEIVTRNKTVGKIDLWAQHSNF